MNVSEKFLEYVDAFELTFEDDNWQRIEAFFTEDATYTTGEDVARGRDAVMAKLRGSIDGLDRRMDGRAPTWEPAQAEGNTVTAPWTMTLSKSGAPDLYFAGVETAVYRDGLIAELRDDIEPDMMAAIGAWMAANAERLNA